MCTWGLDFPHCHPLLLPTEVRLDLLSSPPSPGHRLGRSRSSQGSLPSSGRRTSFCAGATSPVVSRLFRPHQTRLNQPFFSNTPCSSAIPPFLFVSARAEAGFILCFLRAQDTLCWLGLSHTRAYRDTFVSSAIRRQIVVS